MLLCCGSVSAAPLQTIPIEEIKPGQVGYGLTVFRGFKVERFRVEVIDVMKNFLPKQDIFLVRIDHPVLRKTGVVGGMSGSPIMINGKLAGALAYGWRFSKEPITGITPIKNMMRLLKYKPRGPRKAGYAQLRGAGRRPVDRLAMRSVARSGRWWKLPGLRPLATPSSQLMPVSVPLNAAGFSAESMGLLKESFRRYGFEPMQGGGTGVTEGPSKFTPGSSIGVQMARGDVSLAATGTVTWVGPRRVLGFGHRMFNAGEIYIPTTTSKIIHTLASVSRSFKIGRPARVVGSLVQDRQAGIMADTSKQIGTIPMTITMRAPGRKQVYKVNLARHRLLTPSLVRTVMSNALSEAMSDVAHVTFTVTSRISVKGHPQLKLVEHGYAASGVRFPILLFSKGTRVIRKLTNNDFEPATIERLDFDIKVQFANKLVQIKALRTDASFVDPGTTVNLHVTFKPFAGPTFTKSYPLKIPRDAGGTVLVAEVASGAVTRPEVAPPENFKQLLAALQKLYPARSVVVSLQLPTSGLALKGRLIRDLPNSVMDALNTGTQVQAKRVFRTVSRKVHATQSIIAGKQQLRLRVRNEVRQ